MTDKHVCACIWKPPLLHIGECGKRATQEDLLCDDCRDQHPQDEQEALAKIQNYGQPLESLTYEEWQRRMSYEEPVRYDVSDRFRF